MYVCVFMSMIEESMTPRKASNSHGRTAQTDFFRFQLEAQLVHRSHQQVAK